MDADCLWYVTCFAFIYSVFILFFFQILKAMGLAKTSSSAVKLLIDVGYFPVHVNLDLLKLDIATDHSNEVISAAESLLSESSDIDEVSLLLVLRISKIMFNCWTYFQGY